MTESKAALPRQSDDPARAVERVFRAEYGLIIATLIRSCGGGFELAEDAMQEAFAVALQKWPQEGVPRGPAAWISTAARRKAIDRLRRDQAFRRKQDSLDRLVALDQACG